MTTADNVPATNPQKRSVRNLALPAFDLALLPQPIEELVLLKVKQNGGQVPTGDDARRLTIEIVSELMTGPVAERARSGRLSEKKLIGVAALWVGLIEPAKQWCEQGGWLRRRQNNIETIARLSDEGVVKEWAPEEMVARVTSTASTLLSEESRASSTFYAYYDLGAQVLLEEVKKVLPKPGEGDIEDPALAPLPAYIKTRACDRLVESVLQSQKRGGGWVVVTGPTGAGKSSLLATLPRDNRIGSVFAGRVAVVNAGNIKAGLISDMGNFVQAMAVTRQLGLPASTKQWREYEQGLGCAEYQVRPRRGRAAGRQKLQRLEDDEWSCVLAKHLGGRPALIVVDDVADIELLAWARGLPPGVVTVLATHCPSLAEELEVAPDQQLSIEGMEQSEAMQLVTHISSIKGEDGAVAWDCISSLESRPLSVHVLAHEVNRHGWQTCRQILPLHDLQLCANSPQEQPAGEDCALFLNSAWDWLDAELQRCLAILGRLPFFAEYDVELGKAAWGVSRERASYLFDELVAAGFVTRHRDGSYQLHVLVWQLAERKSSVLSWQERWRTRRWFWKYTLEHVKVAWCWYSPSVMAPKYDDLLISQEDYGRLFLFVLRSLCGLPFGLGWWWAKGPIPLRVPEWVVAKRRLVIFWAALFLFLGIVLESLTVRISVQISERWTALPILGVAILAPLLLLFLCYLALVDLDHIVRWHGVGVSSVLRKPTRRSRLSWFHSAQ